jgi:hypothetical protein
MTLELIRHWRVRQREVDAFQLEPGENRSVELELGNGTLLQGVLLDQDERPIGSHELWLERAEAGAAPAFDVFDQGRQANAVTQTDALGRFRFEDVPAGDWLVGFACSAPARADEKEIAKLYASVATIEHMSTDTTREVTLRTVKGLWIKGRVVDRNGAPVQDGEVMCHGPSGQGSSVTRTDALGRFIVGPVVRGECTLTATDQSESLTSAPVTARAGDADVVVKL